MTIMQEGQETLAGIYAGLNQNEFSAAELAEHFLERTKQKNDEIGAYRQVYDDVAEQAERADEQIAADENAPLAGIPIAIKDNILVEGRLVSAGSKMLEHYTGTYDATVVRKLIDAGAVLLGRTNMDEFAMGSSTEHSAYQITKNPHDMSRVPGGSSGGSAAAVAAGMAPVALGSDTGGSIRQPAALCGVVGLKPTYGTVSRRGLIAMASSLDQIGPITRTVSDAEAVFEIIHGHDPLDTTTYSEEALQEAYDESRGKAEDQKFTIGVPEDLLAEGVDKDVLSDFRSQLEELKKAGHEIREISLPAARYALSTYYIIMPAEVSSNLARFDGVKYGFRKEGEMLAEMYAATRGEGFGKEVRRRIMLGTYVLSAGYADQYYNKAIAVRQKISQDFDRAFANVDVIATPTSPTPAFPVGEMSDPLSMYAQDIFTVPANIAGIPAISLPSGTVSRTHQGKTSELPLGLHLMGPALGEPTLFTLGKQFLGENN